jgi:HAD superfamily hydrolase (TIGR01509 family)
MTLLQGVLWDMDGTLVDTEPYWFRAEAELMTAWGVPWGQEDSKRLVGSALPVYARIAQAAGVNLSSREIIEQLLAAVIAQTRQAIPWRPGARELLTQLRQAGIPMGLVTMSEAALANEIVAELPENTFSVQVTGEAVERGKPAPDPYLLGARLLMERHPDREALSLDRMVAIEDSEPGVTSAIAAGITTIGVPNIVAIPARPGLTLWDTLAGKTITDLQALLAVEAVGT